MNTVICNSNRSTQPGVVIDVLTDVWVEEVVKVLRIVKVFVMNVWANSVIDTLSDVQVDVTIDAVSDTDVEALTDVNTNILIDAMTSL